MHLHTKQVMTGDLNPYNNISFARLREHSAQGRHLALPNMMPERIQQLCTGCWKADREERISIVEVLRVLKDLAECVMCVFDDGKQVILALPEQGRDARSFTESLMRESEGRIQSADDVELVLSKGSGEEHVLLRQGEQEFCGTLSQGSTILVRGRVSASSTSSDTWRGKEQDSELVQSATAVDLAFFFSTGEYHLLRNPACETDSLQLFENLLQLGKGT